jgi:hypothetical protein
MVRVAMNESQDGPDDGIAVGPVPGRRVGIWRGEPRAEDGDRQQIQKSVEHDVLTRFVAHGLLGEQRHERGLGVRAPIVTDSER